MAIYVQKIPTFETNSWDGSNTAAFKAWAEPFLPALPSSGSRVWDVIDNENDPENTIPDGILRVQVTGQSMSFYTTFFVLDEIAVAGPLYDGLPTVFAGSGVTSQSTSYVDTMLVEVEA